MARFLGTVQGQRGAASRLGSVKSGLAGKVNGWNVGVRVEARVGSRGLDELTVYATGGSQARGSAVAIGTLEEMAGAERGWLWRPNKDQRI